jgi:class 3 adenylate cyclase
VVEEHRGHVLELRGDEALVVFGSPRSAIRGAVALQQRFVEETIADPSLALTVGSGWMRARRWRSRAATGAAR